MRGHSRSSRSAVVILAAFLCCAAAGGLEPSLTAADAFQSAPSIESGTVTAESSTAPAKLPPVVALDSSPGPPPAPARNAGTALTSGATLAVGVLAIAALALAQFMRVRHRAPLPPDVFDVLGSASLGGHHGIRIVRFGPKTLLVSVSAGGCRTLGEVTDPQATACIVAACRGAHSPRAPRGASAIVRAAVLILGVVIAGNDPIAARATEPSEAAEPAVPPASSQDRPADQLPIDRSAADQGSAERGMADVVTRVLGNRSLDTTLSAAVVFGVASLAPAVLLMTTSFVRMSVVLSLLRQGLGTQHLPSNQIVTSLALFLSALVMWPVWTQAWRAGVEPYQEGRIGLREAYEQGTLPVRRWMAGQIEQAGNRETVLLFLQRHPDAPREVKTYDDVPVEALLPAFLVSELETAFAIGFRLLLPFLVLDIVVATVVVATGLVMLPPSLVSLPLKLLVFVMADGWSLVVQSLLDSVRLAGS